MAVDEVQAGRAGLDDEDVDADGGQMTRVKAEMAFEVQLVDPAHNRRPYFRKNYRLSAESVQRRKDEVPVCVYSCIQNLARSFLEDVSKDSLVIARLKALGGD